MRYKEITVIGRDGLPLVLQAAWVGKCFAVTVAKGIFLGIKSKQYCITHLQTGGAVGGTYSFTRAVWIAKKLDLQPEWGGVKRPFKTMKTARKYKALFNMACT
jgi:hypothetical protein